MSDDDDKSTTSTSIVEISVGQRATTKLVSSCGGFVRHVGKCRFADGEWVGLELDLPDGKNNGTVSGMRYFECEMNHGIFVPYETCIIEGTKSKKKERKERKKKEKKEKSKAKKKRTDNTIQFFTITSKYFPK